MQAANRIQPFSNQVSKIVKVTPEMMMQLFNAKKLTDIVPATLHQNPAGEIRA